MLPLLVAAQVQKVAILEPVDKEGNISYGIKLMLRSNLSKAVANTPGYEVYDRSDIDAVMKKRLMYHPREKWIRKKNQKS